MEPSASVFGRRPKFSDLRPSVFGRRQKGTFGRPLNEIEVLSAIPICEDLGLYSTESKTVTMFWLIKLRPKAIVSLISKILIRYVTNFKGYYTANVSLVKCADVCLQTKSKNNHWLFLHLFVCN